MRGKRLLILSFAALLALDLSPAHARTAAPSPTDGATPATGQGWRNGRARLANAVRTFVQRHPRGALATLGTMLFAGGLYGLTGHHAPALSGGVAGMGLTLMVGQAVGAARALSLKDRRITIEGIAKPKQYADAALTYAMMTGVTAGFYAGGQNANPELGWGPLLKMFGGIGTIWYASDAIRHAVSGGRWEPVRGWEKDAGGKD